MQKWAIFKKESNVLNDKGIDPKAYWTILNNFRNNIKIPSVPPSLISDETITNIVQKVNTFNEYFASQCTSLENSSKLPPLLINTDKRLNTVSIRRKDITSIIKSLNSTKAHGFDNISIHITQ